MDKGKIVAIVTGAISILIAIAYLVLVQLIDFRGEMIPAPISQLTVHSQKRCSAVLRDSPLRGFPALKELSRAGVSPMSDCIKKLLVINY
jgi:hypothetical protein